MISYLILHYERPYFLDLHIKLIRKFAPSDTQIIVADDGSKEKVIRFVKEMPIDDLYYNEEKHKNTWSKGSCSSTIRKGRDLAKGEYFLFSEDDFILCPNPFENIQIDENIVAPETKYTTPSFNFFEEALSLFSDKKIKNVQLARDFNRIPVCGEINTNNYKWDYIDHTKKGEFYYSNWPNLSRTEEIKKAEIKDGLAIWSFESYFSNNVRDVFGESNWAVCPKNRFYFHMGFPFSKRPDDAVRGMQKRFNDLKRLQKKVFSKELDFDVKSFGDLLTSNWIKGHFFIDFDELLETDLNTAYFSALKRLENKV